jgi:hypothetical protein
MKKLVLLVVLALGVLAFGSALSFAGTPAPSGTVQLVADPFVGAADIGTRVPMVPKCPCDPIEGCAFQPIGLDCAIPHHCCSCRGIDPALRMCVGVPS